MKYWRGYLVAAIIAACSWGLMSFAQSHWVLMDMVYPYMTRLIMSFMAEWSSEAIYCVWQIILAVIGLLVIASVVLMIVLRWNVIQWFGWVLSVVSVLGLVHTAVYGLNYYAGDLSEDIRLNVTEYTVSELEDTTIFLRDQANDLARKMNRDSTGQLKYPEFDQLAEMAAEGFRVLTYEESNSVFAGSLIPVKELGWSDLFTKYGITGVTCGITGEAAVNPQVPAVGLPFAICREMACRMSIVAEADANFAAFLACRANSDVRFQYSAFLMAFRYCYNALSQVTTTNGKAALARVEKGISTYLRQDLDNYNAVFGNDRTEEAVGFNIFFQVERGEEGASAYESICDLLVSWHIQEYVLPLMVEDKVLFDPMDETQVDLSDPTVPETVS